MGQSIASSLASACWLETGRWEAVSRLKMWRLRQGEGDGWVGRGVKRAHLVLFFLVIISDHNGGYKGSRCGIPTPLLWNSHSKQTELHTLHTHSPEEGCMAGTDSSDTGLICDDDEVRWQFCGRPLRHRQKPVWTLWCGGVLVFHSLRSQAKPGADSVMWRRLILPKSAFTGKNEQSRLRCTVIFRIL